MNHQDIINEIRRKVDIVDIIGERIPLTSRGKNFFGVCPFHEDTNPSMSVSREKQIYTCFSCHATGNVFTFLENYEHLEFYEVLKLLADKVGIKLEGFSSQRKENPYAEWYQIYELSNKYYQNNLQTSLGKNAKSYLKQRGIDEEAIKEFGIGLSLSKKDDLTELLTKKNYSLNLLNTIGLSVGNADIYRDRIMFPLFDLAGKCVGFSGRIYEDKDENKYLNTKETPIFKKGMLLYHYHIAKEEARVKKQVIIMEGFMDVIRASTIGYRNTIALMGTALTKEHINSIKRLSQQVLLCLDGDNPGKKATLSCGEMLENAGLIVKVIALKDDDDPDTFILKYGKERFDGLVEHALYFRDYKIQILKEGVNFQSDEEKANYIHSVLKETTKMTDPIRIEIVLKNLAKTCEIGYNTLEKRFQELKKDDNQKNNTPFFLENSKTSKKKDKYQKAQDAIFLAMLDANWTIDEVVNSHVVFQDLDSRQLQSEITYYYHKYGEVTLADLYTYLDEKKNLLALLTNMETDISFKEITKQELYDYFRVMKEYNKSQEIKRLERKMSEEQDPKVQAEIGLEIVNLRRGE